MERSTLPAGVCHVWRNFYQTHQQDGLGEVFGKQLYSDQRLRQTLDEGTVIEDRRLLRFFKEKGLPLQSETPSHRVN